MAVLCGDGEVCIVLELEVNKGEVDEDGGESGEEREEREE